MFVNIFFDTNLNLNVSKMINIADPIGIYKDNWRNSTNIVFYCAQCNDSNKHKALVKLKRCFNARG